MAVVMMMMVVVLAASAWQVDRLPTALPSCCRRACAEPPPLALKEVASECDRWCDDLMHSTSLRNGGGEGDPRMVAEETRENNGDTRTWGRPPRPGKKGPTGARRDSLLPSLLPHDRPTPSLGDLVVEMRSLAIYGTRAVFLHVTPTERATLGLFIYA